jgi:UDP-N-acetylglucosamine acyltransferase
MSYSALKSTTLGHMSIHPTAIISGDARLGPGVRVGPFAIIEPFTEVGKDCEIRAHSVIKRFTSLGPDNVVYEGAVLGGEPQDLSYRDCKSYLRIGARNRFREGVTIHRSVKPKLATEVGSDGYFMANSHVAHDCIIGDSVIIANNVALAGHVEVGEGSFISGGVVVHQFCRIGKLAMIGGNSKVVQDCLPFVITDGVPARARGLNITGLRRAGLKTNQLQIVKQAYRILLRSGIGLDEAINALHEFEDPLVNYLVSFIRSSERGFCRE